LDIEVKDALEIFTDDDKIILKKYQPRMTCAITGDVSDDNLSLADGKIVLSPEGAELLINEIKENSINKLLSSAMKILCGFFYLLNSSYTSCFFKPLNSATNFIASLGFIPSAIKLLT